VVSNWDDIPPDVFGCRLWGGRLDRDGYPLATIAGSSVRLHRYLYIERHGPIPEGMEVEHRCRRRNCLSDAHHTLLTRSQQEYRKSWKSRVHHKFCDAGHDEMNAMVLETGGRVCRICSKGDRI